MEVQEVDIDIYSEDGSLKDDDPLRVWNRQCQEAIALDGRTFSPGPHTRRRMEQAGFVNVREYPFKLPIGVWPKGKDHVRLFSLSVVSPSMQPVHYIATIRILSSHASPSFDTVSRVPSWNGTRTGPVVPISAHTRFLRER